VPLYHLHMSLLLLFCCILLTKRFSSSSVAKETSVLLPVEVVWLNGNSTIYNKLVNTEIGDCL